MFTSSPYKLSVAYSSFSVILTHSERDTAGGHDLTVALSDACAGVLQIIDIDVNVPNVSYHD